MMNPLAVLVMDLSGFSQSCLPLEGETESLALGRALTRVLAFRQIGASAVAEHGGTWIKSVADDFFAVFPTVQQAADAAAQVIAQIPCAAAIGFGEIRLDAGGPWGVEVNTACRMVFKAAYTGAILPTPRAAQALHGNSTP